MTHEFKVGDRVRLEGAVLGTVLGTTNVRLDGSEWEASYAIAPEAMAHATLTEPAERPALKSGQVWEDASGNEVVLSIRGDGQGSGGLFPFYGSTKGGVRWDYRPDGTRFNEDATGPSYLVKLIEDVAAHTEPCKGMNCGCTDGVNHSPECNAEHAAAIAGGKFVGKFGKQEPKAPPPLDTSKPMRVKRTETEIRYLGTLGDGRIIGEHTFAGTYQYGDHYESELENIPTPKRAMSRDMVMVEGMGHLIPASSNFCPVRKVLARGTITLTEGDGMGEVQS
jgi:hypothetical protein